MAAPDDLSPRGAALWKALGQTLDTPAGALAIEACRTVDRLEKLNRYLTGQDEWLTLTESIEGMPVLVIVNNALAEVRQQQMALKQLLVTLGIDRKASEQGGESPLAQVLKLVADGGATPSGRSAKPRKRPS